MQLLCIVAATDLNLFPIFVQSCFNTGAFRLYGRKQATFRPEVPVCYRQLYLLPAPCVRNSIVCFHPMLPAK